MANDGFAPLLLGVDLGGTHVRVGRVEGGQVVSEHRQVAHLARRLEAGGRKEAFETVAGTLVEAVGAARAGSIREPAALGIAFPGFLEPVSGRLRHSPNLPGLEGVDLRGRLSEVLGLPVLIENDALAAAWGEWCLAAPRPSSLLYLGLGTGVGGGLVLEGRPWRGERGFAMEAGHLCVEPGGRRCGCGLLGCLETCASATGIVRTWVEQAGPEVGRGTEGGAERVAERARAGDAVALGAFARAGRGLAVAVGHLQKVLDVPHVVIGGGVAASWDLLAPAFEASLVDALIPSLAEGVRVAPSTADGQAGMLGAALLAGRSLPRVPLAP